jgi:aryl-alcohol dehydrogenase-like predicted oxidoreductase
MTSSDPPSSTLGLGLAALGRPGYINLGHAVDLDGDYRVPAMEARTHRVLDAAWSEGVRYFDAARSYGLAEQFLGSWLRKRQIPHQDVTVGSKWGYSYTADWKVDAEVHEVKEHSLAVLRNQLRESRENLGSYLRLYQIHSATLRSGVLENQAVLKELAELKREGTMIGLSTSGPDQAQVIRLAATINIDGSRLFDSVQSTWNLLEQASAPALKEAASAGICVIVKEALANGRLTSRNGEPAFATKRSLLEKQAARLGTTADALAIAAALAQPSADVVLSGAATVEQLRSNLQALHVEWDDEARKTLDELVEPPELYWRRRSRLPWN